MIGAMKRMVAAAIRRLFSIGMTKPMVRGLLFDAHPPNTLILADCGREKYVVNSSDRFISKISYTTRRSYDSDKLLLALQLLPTATTRKVLVDIGGNIGTISIFAVKNDLMERCVVFEPDPHNFRLLETNIVLNGLTQEITAHNIALSDGSVSRLEFELSENNYGDHRVRVSRTDGVYGEASRKTIAVPAKCLEDFRSDIDPSSALIWMDTQGYEGYVLSGAQSFLLEGVPLVTEFWPYGLLRSQNYDKFILALTCGNYSSIIDLRHPTDVLKCDVESFSRLKDALGTQGPFTDLLIF